MESMVIPDSAFWQGRRVLLTGHTGFKGSWLALWLSMMGAEVMGVSLDPPSEPNLWELAALSEVAEDVRLDIRDLDALKARFQTFKPDLVFHLAAQALVLPSYTDPVHTFSTNVMGTVNVFESARACDSVRAVINVTSDKCYENREWAWGYRENEPMGGNDPYSCSKGCSELVTAAYRSSFFEGSDRALASVRAGNVIGGGDWAEKRIVPDSVRALSQGEAVLVRNPSATRPWQHVLEPLRGYLLLAERLWANGRSFSEGWNFGPFEEDARSVGELVDHIVANWGGDARWTSLTAEQQHEANYLKLDASKARSRLGWRPLLRFEAALTWTVDWYKSFYQGSFARALSEEQISLYVKGGNIRG